MQAYVISIEDRIFPIIIIRFEKDKYILIHGDLMKIMTKREIAKIIGEQIIEIIEDVVKYEPKTKTIKTHIDIVEL